MLREQRHQAILDYLQLYQYGKIEELSKHLNCAPITIRRDIDYLNNKKLLLKVQGGAKVLLHQNSLLDLEIDIREVQHLKAKEKIVLTASKLLQDGMQIYLDAGTTTALLIPYLKNKHLKIYTNGLHHVKQLIQYQLEVYLIGGQFKASTSALVGLMAVDQISHYTFDIAFLGANAYDEAFGYSTPDMNEAMVKKMAIQQANVAYVLMDESKRNQRSYISFANADEVILISESTIL